MKLFNKIKKCRICKNKNISLILNFGLVPLGNDLNKSKLKALKSTKYPLKLMKCKKCNHFQLSHSVNPKILFAKNYTYITSTTKTFVKHFHNYAEWIINYCNLNKNSLIVDIGSNDGTCLLKFKNKGMKVCGIDPAKVPAKIANNKNIYTINSFFNIKAANQITRKFGYVDLVTSHNVLAHIDNLTEVFSLAYNILKSNGFLCFEIGYFKNVLENNYFDTIYHEHLDYHHASPLYSLLNKIGFTIINFSTNNIQGGSLRILCKKGLVKEPKYVSKFLIKEKKSIIYNKVLLSKWNIKINKNLIFLNKIIKKNIKENKLITGYGAPTKATLLIKLSKIDKNDIKFIYEDNNLKVGRYMPKIGIPIVHTSQINKDKPDIIIIFAWNFKEEIINRLKDKINFNVEIIIPLPKLKIIKI